MPFTRGRERNRPIDSILQEVQMLSDQVHVHTLLCLCTSIYSTLHYYFSLTLSLPPSPSLPPPSLPLPFLPLPPSLSLPPPPSLPPSPSLPPPSLPPPFLPLPPSLSLPLPPSLPLSQGVKEITLLGQNVNSYRDLSETSLPVSASYSSDGDLSRGFTTIYRTRQGGRRFADLLDKVSLVSARLNWMNSE